MFSKYSLFFVALSLTATPLFADTYSFWNGGAAGNWSNSSDWTPTGSPNNTGATEYDVTIGTNAGDYVTLDVSPTINSLTIGNGGSSYSQLSDGGTTSLALTITGELTIESNGHLSLSSSSFNAGSVNNAGYIFLNGGSGTVSGGLTNSSTLNVQAGSSLTVAGTLTQSASSSYQYGTFLYGTATANALVNNGNFSIETGGTLNLTNGLTNVASGSYLYVYGTANSGGTTAGQSTFSGLNNVAGALYLSNGQTNLVTPTGGPLMNSSHIYLEGTGTSMVVQGDFTNASQFNDYSGVGGGLTVNGTLTNQVGADLNVYNSDKAGTVVNAGTVTLDSNYYAGPGGSLTATNYTNSGTTTVNVNSLSVTDLFTNSGYTYINGTSLTVGSISNSGSLYLSNAPSRSNGSNGTVSGDVSNSGTFNVSSGSSLSVAGTFTNESGGEFYIANTATVGALSNSGQAEVDSNGTLNVTTGINTLASGSKFFLYGTLNSGGTSPGASTFNGLTTIAGALYLENGQTNAITPTGGTLTSSGSIYLLNGAGMVVAGTLTNSGEIVNDGNLVSATNYINTGKTYLNTAGLDTRTLTNGGIISAGGETLAVGSGILPNNPANYYQFADGTLTELIYGAASDTNNDCSGLGDCGRIYAEQSAYLNGMLDAQLEEGFDPANGESFVFLTIGEGSITGAGFTLEDPYFNNNTQQWVITYGSNYVELTAEAHPTPEPSVLLLLVVGLAGVGLFTRKQWIRLP